MQTKAEQIQILYEIAMSIGTSHDLHRMMKTSLSTILRKLNCSAGGIHLLRKNLEGKYKYEQIYSIPRKTSRINAYKAALQAVPLQLDERQLDNFKKRLPLNGETEVSSYFHIMELPDFGLIVLIKNGTDINALFIKCLTPLLTKFADACNTCLQENALRESEDKYKTLTENVNVGVYRNSVGPKGKFIEANPAIIKMFAYKSKEEFLSINVADLYQNPEDRKKYNEKMLRDGFVKNEELELMKNGIPFIASVSAVAVKDEKGRVRYYDGIIEDITQRKRAEEALRESESQYRRIFELTPATVAIIDNKGDILDVNTRLYEWLGYKPEEAIGKNFLSPPFIPEESKLIAKEKLSQITQNKDILPCELNFTTKSGEKRIGRISSSPIKDEKGKPIGQLVMASDITEHKLSEDALRQSEERYRTLFEKSPTSITLLSTSGVITDCNKSTEELTGYSKEEIIGKSFEELLTLLPEDMPKLRDNYQMLLKGVIIKPSELEIIRKDGEKRWINVISALLTKEDTVIGFQIISADITDSKQAAEALSDSKNKYKTLTDNINVGIYRNTIGPKGKFVEANPALIKMFGYKSKEEFLSINVADLYQNPEDRKKYNEKMLRDGFVKNEELKLIMKDGIPFIGSVSAVAVKDEKSEIKYYDGIIEDVSDRKLAERDLKESEQKYRTLTESILDAILILDFQGKILFANQSLINMLGFKEPGEEIGTNVFDFVTPEYKEEVKKDLQKVYEGRGRLLAQYKVRTKDCKEFLVEAKGQRITFENKPADLVVFRDITDRKRGEEIQLVLFKISNAVNTTKDLSELFASIRKNLGTIVNTENFYIALYNDEDYTISLPYFVDGSGAYPEPPTAVPPGRSFTAYVIRSGKPLFITDEEAQELINKGEIEIMGTRSKIWLGVPLKIGNEVIGALVVQSYTDPNLYDEKDLEILKFVSGQVAIAIERKRSQDELQNSFAKLEKIVEGTVNALASATEKRDPYTAGHQQRVTVLACAIAKEMKLSEEQIEGIRVAGILHDIGKIYVAAEILNKPIKLSDIEMSLVRTHAQVGYDILKTVEFVFPVAQVVLQHHERLNGSGYPQGFKGEEILLESKILGVSDVVEAMCSHRPYRPAHGTDKALAEIIEQRGILYDPAVVDTCVKLFREGKFKFE